MLVCGNESPMVVVLSGSMEPSMYRGEILVVFKRPEMGVGDSVVYQIGNENKIAITHTNGTITVCNQLQIDKINSALIFKRTGSVNLITVTIKEGLLK